MNTFKAGVAQFCVEKGGLSTNMEKAEQCLSRLGSEGVSLALLPEMWSCGFDYDRLRAYAVKTPDVLERLGAVARSEGMVVAGSLPELSGERVYNTLYVIDRDGILAGSYRKVHLFSCGGEHEHFEAGNRAALCDTSLGRIGLMICYDLRFPELCRTLALKGADIVLVPAQWPRVRAAHWELLLRARAVENQLFVMGANCWGLSGDMDYPGLSQIVSPLGEVLCRAEEGERTVCAEIDYGESEAFRAKIPCLGERMPQVYGLTD